MANNRQRWSVMLFAAVLLAAGAARSAPEPAEKAKPAEIAVAGLGWWRDRELRLSLDRLLGGERGATLDANAIEDAAFLLLSAVMDRGYLKPVIRAELTRPDGSRTDFTLDETLAATLPRPFTARAVRFEIEPGVRYYFDTIAITGLHAMGEEQARAFFRGESALLSGKGARAYSATALQRGLNGLQTELRDRGLADATVEAGEVKMNDATGAVTLRVDVREGLPWRLAAVRVEGGEATGVAATLGEVAGEPWTLRRQQDLGGRIRAAYLAHGYPDVTVTFSREVGAPVDGAKPVTLTAHVQPGTLVHVGQVRFEGAAHTREDVLRRRVRAQPGSLLDPATLEQARYRLGRLGVFEEVDLHYEPADGPVRDPVFTFQERRLWDVSLLAGYGSYEELRGGVELRQNNLFGRAHQTRLLLVQSMKSTRGDYTYTVPELFGESLDGTARVFGLQRQEVAFQRQEYGGSVFVSDRVRWLGATATAGYTFQTLRNRENQLTTSAVDDKQVVAASVDLGLSRDRRDNPLRPRHGYRVFAQAELASRDLGGEVDYQRLVLGVSYHTAWGSGRWVHLGFTHGVVTTLGTATDALLPVNKRFYPGGDSSIRGYREGEAAPRGADGRFIGAKAYVLANVELEQALTGNWSGVVFVDGLGTAARLQDYPFSQQLYAAGAGIRYNSLIGPIRAEYGYNLRRREGDPAGTFLLSIGVPF